MRIEAAARRRSSRASTNSRAPRSSSRPRPRPPRPSAARRRRVLVGVRDVEAALARGEARLEEGDQRRRLLGGAADRSDRDDRRAAGGRSGALSSPVTDTSPARSCAGLLPRMPSHRPSTVRGLQAIADVEGASAPEAPRLFPSKTRERSDRRGPRLQARLSSVRRGARRRRRGSRGSSARACGSPRASRSGPAPPRRAAGC